MAIRVLLVVHVLLRFLIAVNGGIHEDINKGCHQAKEHKNSKASILKAWMRIFRVGTFC